MSEIQITEEDKAELAVKESTRTLLDELLQSSQLYKSSDDYFELMEFVARMRNFAPFNAMLLQIQKPGLRYAASERDWRERFGRRPKENARPLLILWPFGPVALVYDVIDTEGRNLPEDVYSFVATGEMDEERFYSIIRNVRCNFIELKWPDLGDLRAGSISVLKRSTNNKQPSHYRLTINNNHSPPVKFSTIAHELGHLYLGHLGADSKLNIPKRRNLSHQEKEIEAESVAYLVCHRNGVTVKSHTYLTTYMDKGVAIGRLEIYQIMRAAGQVETLLGLTAHTKFDKPGRLDEPVEVFVGDSFGATNHPADFLDLKNIRGQLQHIRADNHYELLGYGIELSVFHIENGSKSFVRYAKAMVKDIGKNAKPYLKSWYMMTKNLPRINSVGMDSESTVNELQVDDII